MATKTRLLSIFPQNLSATGKTTTDNVTEGITNLYYTDARFDTRLGTKTTTNLAEGINLYYTDARVGSYLTANSYATESYVNTAVSNLVDSAPGALDTLNELAAALGDDANYATTVTNALAGKLDLTGGIVSGMLTVDHSYPLSILALKSAGSTIWTLGVGNSSGEYFNLTADFGSLTVSKYNGSVTTPGNFYAFNNQEVLNAATYHNYALPRTGGSLTGAVKISRGGASPGNISLEDETQSSHLTLAGTDAFVRLQMGTYNYGSFAGWIQASYDNSQYGGSGSSGVEPLALNPEGGNVGVGTSNPVARLDVVGGGLSISGWSNNNSGTSGGVEIGWDGVSSVFQSYDRANSVFEPIILSGSTVNIANNAPLAMNAIPVIDGNRNVVNVGGVWAQGASTDSFIISQNNSTQNPSIALWGADHSSFPGQVHIVSRTSNSSTDSGKIQFWNFNGSGFTNTVTVDKTGTMTIPGNLDFSGHGSILPGHFYTHTHDGSNVYFHTGTATGTSKILNLRVYRADNSVGTHQFYPDVLYINGQPVLHSGGGYVSGDVRFTGTTTLGVRNNSLNFGGNTGGLTGSFLTEIRASSAAPTLTFHYENVATKHIQLQADGALTFISPSSENSGNCVLRVNGYSEINGNSQTNMSWHYTTSARGGTLTLKGTNNAYGSGGALYLAAQIDNNTEHPQWAIKSGLTNGGGYGTGNLTFWGRYSTGQDYLHPFLEFNNNGMAKFRAYGAAGINLATDFGASNNSGRLFFSSDTSSFSIVNTANEFTINSGSTPNSDTGTPRIRMNSDRTQIGPVLIYNGGTRDSNTYTHADSFYGTQVRQAWGRTQYILPNREIGGPSFTTPYVVEFRTPNNESNSANTYYPVSFNTPNAGSGGALGNLWITRKYWDEGPAQRGGSSIGWNDSSTHQGGLDLCLRVAESAWSDKWEVQVLWYRYSYHTTVSNWGMQLTHDTNYGSGTLVLLLRGGFYYRIFADYPIAPANVTPGGPVFLDGNGNPYQTWMNKSTTVDRAVFQSNYSIGTN